MTILMLPNLGCPNKCAYCFARPVWSVANEMKLEDLNIHAMIEKFLHLCGNVRSVCLHAGEPLALSIDTLRDIFEALRSKGIRPSIQTSGYNLDKDEYIDLLAEYQVSVGLSCDGFPEHMSGRRKELAKIIIEAIPKLRSKGIQPSMLIVLTKYNATADKIDRLCEFYEWVISQRVCGRFLFGHAPLFLLDKKETFELTPDELYFALEQLFFVARARRVEMQWSPFRDLILSLRGENRKAVCWCNPCDPYCNRACMVILPDGTLTLCDRQMQHGILERPVPEKYILIRQQVLEHTDCKGCKYWGVCVGGCPTDGIDGDWRRKTRWCKTIYKMLELLESLGYGKAPSPTRPTRAVTPSPTPRPPQIQATGRPHSDGIIHEDGDVLHADSGLLEGHWDGIEHTDGTIRHLDG